MPPARPQQMSDPADKSDDLIAEVAKLMAAGPGGQTSNTSSFSKPAMTSQPAASQAPAAAPPVRIPGMAAPAGPASAGPRPAAPQPELRAVPQQAAPQPSAPQAAAPRPANPQAELPRAVATGTLRIPGMDQPAPVSTSAPVSKFDFGKPSAPAPIKQEPLSTLSERLAAQNPSTARAEPLVQAPAAPAAGPAPVRIPSALTPVSENKSFGEGLVLPVGKPAAAT